MDLDRYYPVPEAAREAGNVTKWAIHKWFAQGKLKRTKIGARSMVLGRDLQAFIDSCNEPKPVATIPEDTMTDTCKHVPARPDVDLTLCWICSVEIIPDPDTHLWRPLTASEKLVKHEVTRQLRDLFHSVHPSEFGRVLHERLEIKGAPAIRLAEGFLGHWIIVNGQDESLAWSGSRWVPHRHGYPTGDVQVCNFETREEAKTYAEERFSTN